jgi:large subunit ribosomal protein L35e
VRKAIAKVLTVINEKRRNKARDDHKKKRTPLDLRRKKTRAFRKRMTKFERSKKTLRQQKKESNFRPRKFALAA